MEVKLSGRVVKKFDLFTSGNFKKREILIENNGKQYKIDYIFNSVEWVNNIKIGDLIDTSVTISVREFNGSYYTSLIGNTLKRFTMVESHIDVEKSTSEFNRVDKPTNETFVDATDTHNDNDDLPF